MGKTQLHTLLCAVFILFANTLFAKDAQPATVEAISNSAVHTTGEFISMIGSGFDANDKIQTVLLTYIGEDRNIVGSKTVSGEQLALDASGNLSGGISLATIPANARWVEILPVSKTSKVRGSQWLPVRGNSPISSGNTKTAGTVVISDAVNGDNDGFASTSENIDTDGTGWTGTLFAVGQREYTDISGTAFIQSTALGTGNASIAGGTLSGFVTTTATFDASARSINLLVSNDAVEFTQSNVLLTLDTVRPSISSAAAIALDTIQVVFDEELEETGDASARFALSGTDAGVLTITDLFGVSGDTSSTWNLALSGNLPDLQPDLTVTYNEDGGGTNMLADVPGNQVNDGSNASVADSLAPSAPTLTNPLSGSILSGQVTLIASADASSTDPSMSSVRFEGSNSGTVWTTLGTDTDVSDATYSFAYGFGTQYAFYRAVAVDDAGNETPSASSVNFLDAYRIEIISFDSPVSAGQRSRFEIQIQNNYANGVDTTSNLNFALSSSQGTGIFYDQASGGTSITSINIAAGDTTAVFWYEDSDDDTTPSITVNENAGNLPDPTDIQQITITAATIVDFLVETENAQSETAGTSFSITITARQAGGATATDYVGTHTLDFSTTATASPDGTAPITPADGQYTFTAGVTTIAGGGTLYNSGETPTITVTEGAISTTTGSGAGAGVTVADGPTAEARIKTADESADGNYANNLTAASEVQGPTFADPDVSVSLFGVVYDEFGNLRADESGTWSAETGLDGAFSLGGSQTDNTFTFSSGANAGTTYSGTLIFDVGGGIIDSTAIYTVDDSRPATVLGFNVFTDPDDNTFVVASWTGTSSGDDGTTGTPTSYEIRWVDGTNNAIDTDPEWDAATSVGTAGQPVFSSNTWRIDMSGFVQGEKYFAIRTTDNVGNISVLDAGSYTITKDLSLPVSLVLFEANGGFDNVRINWETASELDNEGFFLFRSNNAVGPFAQALNPEIIAGNGTSNQTNRYQYIDTNVESNRTYYYKIVSRDFNGTIHESPTIVSATVLTAPRRFELAQNFPNPFNPETKFQFSMAKTSAVSLVVYNVLGQKIKTVLNNETLEPGIYSNFGWDATNDLSQPVANGIYYLVMTVNATNFSAVRKMVYIQ